jgi:hypothetical protein
LGFAVNKISVLYHSYRITSLLILYQYPSVFQDLILNDVDITAVGRGIRSVNRHFNSDAHYLVFRVKESYKSKSNSVLGKSITGFSP